MTEDQFTNYVRCQTCEAIIHFEKILIKPSNLTYYCPSCGNENLVNLRVSDLRKINEEKEFNPSRADNGIKEVKWIEKEKKK